MKLEALFCRCGKCMNSSSIIDQQLISKIEFLENEVFKKELYITSGYRCPSHNKKVGGASKSQHVLGKAVDFRVPGMKTTEAFKIVYQHFGDEPMGLSVSINIQDEYRGFIHMDTRGRKARWAYNNNGLIFLKELGIL